MQSEQYSQRALQPLQLRNRTDGMTTVFLSPFPRGILFTTWHSSKFQICRLGSHRNFACVKTPLFKSFQNDQIWPILQQKTIPIVFELDPLFLIRAKINIETGRTEQATEKKKIKKALYWLIRIYGGSLSWCKWSIFIRAGDRCNPHRNAEARSMTPLRP